MSPARGILAWIAGGALCGCALAARSSRDEVDRARLAHARELAAERRAPIAFEHYRAAQRAALGSKRDSPARSVAVAEARLWLEPAISEAERVFVSERRLQEERSLLELEAATVALERERAALARTAELRGAQALARDEAQKALARAAERPDLRVKLGRDEQKRAVEALLARAELIALTLESLGQEASELSTLRAKLAQASALAQREPGAALGRADQTLFYALRLLGTVRGQRGEPDELEKSALSEELASAGAAPTRGDQGLTGVVARAFQDGALVPEAERVVERLCALAVAHARGPVRLAVQASNEHQADQRVRAVRKSFGEEGCQGERFVIAVAKAPGDALEASWLAY